MKKSCWACFLLALILASCAPSTPFIATATASPASIQPTSTPRVLMLPTWTPSITPSPRPSLTPRPTNTPLVPDQTTIAVLPGLSPASFLLDRPTYAKLTRPTSLVSLEYDPTTWSLETAYPASLMAYSLTHRLIYGCTLAPVGQTESGDNQVEKYTRPLGSTAFQITRVSQLDDLLYATYCTGEGEDATCYQMTPGDDHETCTGAAETVLSTLKIVPNPFLEPVVASPNHWLCQDQSGIDGRCTVSYSVPLNTFAFLNNGEAWASGDDGLLFHLVGTAWQAADSPTSYSIYDMSFSSSTNGWAVGKGAQVLRWDGNTWTQALPYHAPGEGPGGSTQVLYGVDAAGDDNAWMVGLIKDLSGKNYPYALHWNGTDLLEETAFPDCGGCNLNAVAAISPSNVLAVGGSSLGAIAFHWDGSTWTSVNLPGADTLYALEKAPDGSVWAGGIEYARDQSDTRGALFRWDGSSWLRVAVPPLTGGIYQLVVLPAGQVVVGGDFSALWSGEQWQPIVAGLAGYGWIADIEIDPRGMVWALTHSGIIFQLEITP